MAKVFSFTVTDLVAKEVSRIWELRDDPDVSPDLRVWSLGSPGSFVAVLNGSDGRSVLHFVRRIRAMGPVTEHYVSFVLSVGDGEYREVTDIRCSDGGLRITVDDRDTAPVVKGTDLPSAYEVTPSAQLGSEHTSYIVCFGCAIAKGDGWVLSFNGNTAPIDRFTVYADRVVFHRRGMP